jgi:hypothetical protein
MNTDEDDLTAALLRSRVRKHGEEVVVVAPDAELEKLGEAAMIASHDAVDPVVVGRRLLTTLAAHVQVPFFGNGAISNS